MAPKAMKVQKVVKAPKAKAKPAAKPAAKPLLKTQNDGVAGSPAKAGRKTAEMQNDGVPRTPAKAGRTTVETQNDGAIGSPAKGDHTMVAAQVQPEPATPLNVRTQPASVVDTTPDVVYRSRSEMMQSLVRQAAGSELAKPREGAAMEEYVEKMRVNLERTKAARVRADEQVQILQREVGINNREIQQLQLRVAEGITDNAAIARVAEMFANEIMRADTSLAKRKKLQNKLLACLTPDKLPAPHVAAAFQTALCLSSSWAV